MKKTKYNTYLCHDCNEVTEHVIETTYNDYGEADYEEIRCLECMCYTKNNFVDGEL